MKTHTILAIAPQSDYSFSHEATHLIDCVNKFVADIDDEVQREDWRHGLLRELTLCKVATTRRNAVWHVCSCEERGCKR